MSRSATIEEVFDDDTDLPLPTRPLPTSSTAPILDQIGTNSELPGWAQSARSQPSASASRVGTSSDNPLQLTDDTPFKKWTIIYPIYIDASQPFATGCRRIARDKAVWWPLSKDIADTCSKLGLKVAHEPVKAHPRDWSNPGRVRVAWKIDGQLANSKLKTKKLLFEAIAAQIQKAKPSSVPRRPYEYTAPAPSTAVVSTKASTAGKSKQKSLPTPIKAESAKRSGRSLPIPNGESTLSTYSPAVPSGILVDAIKNTLQREAEDAAKEKESAQQIAGGAAGGAAGKGKRKVVRVRA